jgi:hypothetical protein
MSSNRLIYDKCAYGQKIQSSTDPLSYQLFTGKFENCGRCNKTQTYSGQYENCGTTACYKNNKTLLRVDVESDLRGIDRVASQCSSLKYHPNCNNPSTCVSKNDSRVPTFSPPYLCEIRPTNASKATHAGYNVPNPNACLRK